MILFYCKNLSILNKEIYIKYIRRENIRNINPPKTNDFPPEGPVAPKSIMKF